MWKSQLMALARSQNFAASRRTLFASPDCPSLALPANTRPEFGQPRGAQGWPTKGAESLAASAKRCAHDSSISRPLCRRARDARPAKVSKWPPVCAGRLRLISLGSQICITLQPSGRRPSRPSCPSCRRSRRRSSGGQTKCARAQKSIDRSEARPLISIWLHRRQD